MATIYGDRWEIVKDLPEGGQAHTFLVKDIKSGEGKLYVLALVTDSVANLIVLSNEREPIIDFLRDLSLSKL